MHQDRLRATHPVTLNKADICIYIAKQKPANVLNKFEQITVGEMGMSIITYSELLYGARKSHHPKKSLEILEDLASLIPPLPKTL